MDVDGDGRADYLVTGTDLNNDGIPDALQRSPQQYQSPPAEEQPKYNPVQVHLLGSFYAVTNVLILGRVLFHTLVTGLLDVSALESLAQLLRQLMAVEATRMRANKTSLEPGRPRIKSRHHDLHQMLR